MRRGYQPVKVTAAISTAPVTATRRRMKCTPYARSSNTISAKASSDPKKLSLDGSFHGFASRGART